MPVYRYTPGKIEDNYHPRRQMIHLWAAAWTETIAMAVDGLDQGQRWDRYSAEDRARAVAMVREGATYRAAAEALGMSIGAVSGACDRAGFKKREIA